MDSSHGKASSLSVDFICLVLGQLGTCMHNIHVTMKMGVTLGLHGDRYIMLHVQFARVAIAFEPRLSFVGGGGEESLVHTVCACVKFLP